MMKRHQDKAAQIIEAFRNSLDVQLQQQISDAQLKDLEAMIVEAIGEELGIAAERVDQVVKQLRAESERPDLGL
jgi:hypothetical protein